MPTRRWRSRRCACWVWLTGRWTSLPDPENRSETRTRTDVRRSAGHDRPGPPGSETRVQIAHGAGLKSVMVTGDYRDTAIAIAEEIGMLSPGGKVLTGAELDKMSDEELAEIVE